MNTILSLLLIIAIVVVVYEILKAFSKKQKDDEKVPTANEILGNKTPKTVDEILEEAKINEEKKEKENKEIEKEEKKEAILGAIRPSNIFEENKKTNKELEEFLISACPLITEQFEVVGTPFYPYKARSAPALNPFLEDIDATITDMLNCYKNGSDKYRNNIEFIRWKDSGDLYMNKLITAYGNVHIIFLNATTETRTNILTYMLRLCKCEGSGLGYEYTSPSGLKCSYSDLKDLTEQTTSVLKEYANAFDLKTLPTFETKEEVVDWLDKNKEIANQYREKVSPFLSMDPTLIFNTLNDEKEAYKLYFYNVLEKIWRFNLI